MSIYEELKGGKTPEDLLKAYSNEVNAAIAKLDQEKRDKEAEAQKNELINTHREKLIDAILEYAAALFGDEIVDKEIFSTLKNILLEFEADTKKNKNPNIRLLTKYNFYDNKIIESFLATL